MKVIELPEVKDGPTPEEPLVRVTNRVATVCVTGYLLLFDDDKQPIYIQCDGAKPGDLFIPLFSNREALVTGVKDLQLNFDRVVEITDHREFIDSIPSELRIIVDPRILDSGNARFVELYR